MRKIIITVFFIGYFIPLFSQSLPLVQCQQWAIDVYNDLAFNCNLACPGDLNNGPLLEYEMGAVFAEGEEVYYLRTTGGSFDFSCAETVFYDENGFELDRCVYGFGTACTTGYISDPFATLNYDYQLHWDCINGFMPELISLTSIEYTIDGFSVDFSSVSENVNTYLWDFGDGGFSSLAAPIHTYSSSGVYTVMLSVENACGIETLSETITVGSSSTPVLCKNWVRDRVLQDFSMCGTDCNGVAFNTEFGTVDISGTEYFYYRSIGNFNDCYAYEIYDECGLRVDYCTYCVGCSFPTTCYTGIVDANEVFNYTYTPLWQCGEQLPFCIPENCNIITNLVSALCQDRGTSDPTDDSYLFNYEVNNSRGSGDYYLGVDGVSDLTQISYGGNHSLAIEADGLPHLITFTDVEDQSCCITIETDSLKACSIQNCDFNCTSPTFNLVTAPLNIGINDFIPTARADCGFSFQRDMLEPNYYLDCRYLKGNQLAEDSLYIYQLDPNALVVQDSCLIYFSVVNDGACTCNHPDYGPLMALYRSTNGDGWNNNDGWRDGASGVDCDPCGWHGISCENIRVVGLELGSNNLQGIIPNQIGEIEFLERLSLTTNNLIGPIPSSLGALEFINTIALFQNNLSGEIFSNLTNSHGFKNLAVSYNSLEGRIPDWIGQCDSILNFDAIDNNLSGEIPVNLGEATTLTNLVLAGNNLSGCFPSSMINLCGMVGPVSLQGDNPLLAWQGDFLQFCAAPNDQIGALCQLENGEPGIIDENCMCVILEQDTVSLIMNTTSGAFGDTVELNILVENFNNIESFQFPISWDSLKLEYTGLFETNPQIQFNDYAENSSTKGRILTFYASGASSLNIPNSQVLLNYKFKVISENCDSINFLFRDGFQSTNNQFAIEIFENNFALPYKLFEDFIEINSELCSSCSEDGFIFSADIGQGEICTDDLYFISVELSDGSQDSIVIRPRPNPFIIGAAEIVGASPLTNINLDLISIADPSDLIAFQTYDVFKLGEENCPPDTTFSFPVYVEFKMEPLEDVETCLGEQLSISLNVSGGQERYSYYWYTAEDSLTTNETLDILVEEDLEIFVLVEDFYGQTCILRDTFLITIQPDIDFSFFMCEPSTDEVVFTWSSDFDDVSFTVLSGQTSSSQANGTTLTIDQLSQEEEVRVAFEVTQGCLVQSDTITCSALLCPTVDLMIIAPSELCLDDAPVELSNNQINNTDLKSGTYSSDLGNRGEFDPMDFGVGVHKVWYVTVSVPECIYSDTMEIEVVAPPADEDFGVIELCAEDLASYTSTADPNGDGVIGWQGGQALVFGINEVVVSNGVCDYQQVLEIVEVLENDCNPCDHPDFQALMALYDSTKGSEWNNNNGWKDGAEGTNCDPCSWSGITCKNGRVSELRFISRGLKGMLPTEIGQLDSIERLEIRRDSLFGNIPASIGNLKKIEYLSLRDNYLSGGIPPTIALLPKLKQLRLTLNNLSGELPTNYTESLEVLLASSNDFTGSVPEQLNSAKALSVLGLAGNQLSGKIPFASLQNLKDINLSRNNLTGTIVGIQNLTNLEGINLFQNQISGNIPKELGELKKLTYLNLFRNDFLGEIPSTIIDLDSLRLIQLYDNNLTGEIPRGVFDLPKLEFLYLSGNNFEGCIPIDGEFICNSIQNDLNDTIRTRDETSIFYDLSRPGYDLRNNPLLPWEGDMTNYCEGEDQIGAPCLLEGVIGRIDENCNCALISECDFLLNDELLSAEIGQSYTIDLLSNDILPDSFSLTGLGFSAPDLFENTSIDERGVLAFDIIGSFYDTIFYDYQVCDLSCNECQTAQAKILNADLEDIVLTNFINRSNPLFNSLKFTNGDVLEESELWIYNRWGDKIYHSENYENDWNADGYPAGIYFYVLEIRGVTIKKTLTILD